MKTGTWYVAGFVIAFVYFYVYAVNYVRGDPAFFRRQGLWPNQGGGGGGLRRQVQYNFD